MHRNPLVEFLRAYGPNAASDALYDEHVQSEARKHGVNEIKLSAPLIEQLGERINHDDTTNVILTGTAGDGKTYHIRRIALEYLGVKPEEWPGDELILTFRLAGGGKLRVIRDLSELPDDVKAGEIGNITRCLLGRDKETAYLVAANDGQLLEMWRSNAQREDLSSEAQAEVYRLLSKMLREETKTDTTGTLNVVMHNLSRQVDTGVVDEAIDGLLGHPMWESSCVGCSLFNGEKACPIRTNRRLLMGEPSDPESHVFRNRLRDVIEVATANDQHVPLRQILTLVVNIVLGDAEDTDNPLLTCETARERAEAGRYAMANPYDNALGANLAEDMRHRYAIFSTLESYGIGVETTNQFDEVLLYDHPNSIAEKLERIDPMYGKTIFSSLRKQYINGARDRSEIGFPPAMTSQRRRLFFQWPYDAPKAIDSHSTLTVFHNGGDYLSFRRAVSANCSPELITKVSRQLVKGFNRALTGMMTEDTERLWLAGTVGKSDDPTGKILAIPPVGRSRSAMHMVYMEIVHDENRNRPQIRVTVGLHGTNENQCTPLDIRPLLFEYLIRVAEGRLPSSFSRQCHQEVKHFATMLRQQISEKLSASDLSIERVNVLSLDSDASIKQEHIKAGATR